MKDRCILPELLCATSGQLVHAFMWRHVFLEAVFPNIVQFVQFPCVIDVNCMIFTICTPLLYSCFVFCFEFVLYILFQTTCYVFHVNSCIHINMTDYHARDLHLCQYLSWCSDIYMNILIFDEDCSPYVIYFYISYTVTITLIIF